MAYALRAAGGGLGGGQGQWGTARSAPCRLVLTEYGLRAALDRLSSDWDGTYRVGLFQGDVEPRLSLDVADLVPCDFSGYAGLQLTTGWSMAAISGERAISQAEPLAWTHNGGPVGNWVYGYYVVDGAGLLVWAERFCPAPLTVDRSGQKVRVIPTFYLLNEFPE